MIQDIAPHIYDNQFNSRRAPKPTDHLLIHRKNQMLVSTKASEDGQLIYPKAGELPETDGKAEILTMKSSEQMASENEVPAQTEEAREDVPGVYIFRGQRLIWLFRVDDEAFFAIDHFRLPAEMKKTADFSQSPEMMSEKTADSVQNMKMMSEKTADSVQNTKMMSEKTADSAQNTVMKQGTHMSWEEYQEAETAYLAEIFPGFGFQPNTICRKGVPRYLAFAGITGSQLCRWRSDHHFCGRCGAKMKTSELERAYVCPRCRATVYPKICPAVIVAIRNGDKILVSKYADRNHTTNYALIAGFAEVGETIEETVHREVMEEVGVKVKNLKFYKSQPWSFSDTLLMGFYCELDGDETISLDRNELAMAAWLTREEMPERSDDISLTAEMMENFRTGKA